MIAVPPDTPNATPVVASIVAMVDDDDQVPPAVALLRDVAVPAHRLIVPKIAVGTGFTVTVALPVMLLVQPVLVFVATTV